MENFDIKIQWEGSFSANEVVSQKNDPNNDYGLYQIYAKHILCGDDALIYVGIVIDETFSERLKKHWAEWLTREEGAKIFLGRVYNPERHSEADNWNSWTEDIQLAERILIYKYSPHYNNVGITNPPTLPCEIVRLIHNGEKHRLKTEDAAPRDFLLL
ncbi:hypothetical protein ACFL2J_00115 [Candidatus Omnitrophota bacterium]